MPSTCAFVLDNGRPCAAPALRNDRYCRHHTPAALARRRQSSAQQEEIRPEDNLPDENTSIPPAHLRAYWRMHHNTIATSVDDEELQEIFAMILEALSEHAISPRSAGRLLQAVSDRRKVLAAQAQEAAFRALEEKVRRHKAAHSVPPATVQPHPAHAARTATHGRSPDGRALLEALTSALFPSGAAQRPARHPFGASESYPVSR